MIDVESLVIPEVKLITPRVHRDARGFFVERYRRDLFADAGIDTEFVQDNHSRSDFGTVRGLHFQRPPNAQAKLVCVTRGSIYDVAVDVRIGSPTYGRWVGALLDEERMQQLYVPAGFAHGFAVHSMVADVLYKVNAPYAPLAEGGIRWDDETLAIDWGVEEPIVSDRDAGLPALQSSDAGFTYESASG